MNIKVYKPSRKISVRIISEQLNDRSGVISLTNILGTMKFRGYIFGSNTEDMRNDWRTIGNDIRKAMKAYEAK